MVHVTAAAAAFDKHSLRVLLLATTLAFLAGTASFAQSGGIEVTVFDEEGQTLPGATVTLSNELGYVRTAAVLTDARGSALFPVLRPGQGYAIHVDFPGLSPVRQEGLRVTIGDVEQLEIQLVRGLEEHVRVVAERDVIDLEATESSTKFTQAFVSDLPVPGRFYQNVLTLAPGVQDADGDGNPNVHGSRDRDFSALVGGVRNQDPLTGHWMSNINPNSIEELEVITSGAGVEFGRAQGGFGVIVQKQGSNEHEGVFELFYRSSKLDGESAGVSATSDDGPFEEADYEWWQPSIQLSGPILRDRLWYRLSHERRDIEEPLNFATRVDTTETDAWTHSDQITWQVSPRNKLALLYQSDPNLQTKYGLSSIRPATATWDQERTGESFSLNWTAPYSPKVLTEAVVAWQDLNLSRRPSSTGVRNTCLEGRDFLELSQCQDLAGGGEYSGSYYRTEEDHSQRFTASGKATIYGRFWGASHQFKVGLSIENERYFRSLEQLPFGSLEVERVGLVTTTQYLTRLSVPETDDVRATGTNWGLYFEDQIKPLSNLALTLGLRVDREEINSEGRSPFDPQAELAAYEAVMNPLIPTLVEGEDADLILYNNLATENWPHLFTGYEGYNAFVAQMQDIICEDVPASTIGQCLVDVREEVLNQQNESLSHVRTAEDVVTENTNFSPFVALAWSPWKNGKTAIKFSAGRHYNTIPLIIPLQELEPALTELAYIKPQTSSAFQLSGGIQPTLTVRSVDRQISTPYQDELSFKIERELWPETSISVEWIDRQYEDQLQDINVNVKNGDFGNCILNFGITRVDPSPGDGQNLINPITGEIYVDTDPGAGDGLIDDCTGGEVRLPGSTATVNRPDGFADLYIQNPFWGDVFVIGNFNQIDYQAWVVELTRRQYRSWELQASYTYSEAEGDGEDFFQELGQDPSLLQSIQGYQSYDQRHVAKLNVTSITPWGIRLGAAMTWQSGLPYSVIRRDFSLDVLPPLTGNDQLVGTNLASAGGRTRQSYPSGERNDARNVSYWNVDLRAAKEFGLGRGVNAQLSAELFNLLDDETYMIYNNFEKFGQQINGANEAILRPGRQWQLGLKVAW